MRATADTLNNISLFEDRLVKAFRKMILGICVELSDEGKEVYAKANLSEGQWYFIKSINDDESIGSSIAEGRDLKDKSFNLA